MVFCACGLQAMLAREEEKGDICQCVGLLARLANAIRREAPHMSHPPGLCYAMVDGTFGSIPPVSIQR